MVGYDVVFHVHDFAVLNSPSVARTIVLGFCGVTSHTFPANVIIMTHVVHVRDVWMELIETAWTLTDWT
jgi:hypothetical protein